jgi:hypothetical protein
VRLVQCNYPHCGREEKRDQRCIFHLQNKTAEEVEEFYAELAQHKKKSEEDPSVKEMNFQGFFFPQYKFQHGHFGKTAIFNGAIFSGSASFDDVTFSGFASFDDVTFSEDADFMGAKFNSLASFTNAIFSENAWFGQAKFGSDVAFFGAKFGALAWFGDAAFSRYAFFQHAVFGGETSFNGATFGHTAWFADAAFGRKTSFNGVRFSDYAFFLGAAFSGQASFSDAAFGNMVAFNGAAFSGQVSFEDVKFGPDTSFADAKFGSDVSFADAKFKNVFFRKTKLCGNANLEAEFYGLAVFERVIFQRDTIESSDLAPATRGNIDLPVTSFDGAYVSERAEIRFIQHREYNADLDVERNFGVDRVSFLNVNLERFNFQQVEWGTFHGRRAVVEEVLMGRPPFEDVTPEQVRQLCGRLRANQEKAFRYAEAGDFFIGEMDMRRRWLQDKGWRALPERLLLWLFSGLSRYGESISRPILAGLIIVFGLAALRLVLREPSEWQLYQSLSIEESLVRSLASFFQLRSTTLWTDVLERIVSIPILGVLFIALRRKLERRP